MRLRLTLLGLLIFSFILASLNLPSALAANLAATNAPIVAGGTVNFSGAGFSASEKLSAWTTAPNGDVAAQSQISADAGGQVSYSLSTFGYTLGTWRLTLHGLSSGMEAIASFEVVSNNPAAPVPTATPTANPADPGTIPQGDLDVNPKTVHAGQPVEVRGIGYGANEVISLWETSPQGSVYKLKSIYADANGYLAYTYGTKGPAGGLWAITAHGLTSGVEKTGFVLVQANTAGTARVELTPDSGDTNTQITVRGFNFLPKEIFSYWVTAPDGQVYAGFQGTVGTDGAFSFTYSLPAYKPGRWAITAKGRTSTLEAVAFFNSN